MSKLPKVASLQDFAVGSEGVGSNVGFNAVNTIDAEGIGIDAEGFDVDTEDFDVGSVEGFDIGSEEGFDIAAFVLAIKAQTTASVDSLATATSSMLSLSPKGSSRKMLVGGVNKDVAFDQEVMSCITLLASSFLMEVTLLSLLLPVLVSLLTSKTVVLALMLVWQLAHQFCHHGCWVVAWRDCWVMAWSNCWVIALRK